MHSPRARHPGRDRGAPRWTWPLLALLALACGGCTAFSEVPEGPQPEEDVIEPDPEANLSACLTARADCDLVIALADDSPLAPEALLAAPASTGQGFVIAINGVGDAGAPRVEACAMSDDAVPVVSGCVDTQIARGDSERFGVAADQQLAVVHNETQLAFLQVTDGGVEHLHTISDPGELGAQRVLTVLGLPVGAAGSTDRKGNVLLIVLNLDGNVEAISYTLEGAPPGAAVCLNGEGARPCLRELRADALRVNDPNLIQRAREVSRDSLSSFIELSGDGFAMVLETNISTGQTARVIDDATLASVTAGSSAVLVDPERARAWRFSPGVLVGFTLTEGAEGLEVAERFSLEAPGLEAVAMRLISGAEGTEALLFVADGGVFAVRLPADDELAEGAPPLPTITRERNMLAELVGGLWDIVAHDRQLYIFSDVIHRVELAPSSP